MTMSEPATPTTPRKRRRWPRWAAALALVLLAGGGVVWWVMRVPPLTAEEQQFVGVWKRSSEVDHLMANGWHRLEAVEFRADRTIRYHYIVTETGARFAHEGAKWSVYRGRLTEVYPTDPVSGFARGDFRLRTKIDWRIMWEEPNRFVADRADQPPPRVTYPTLTYTRCPAPGGP
jgi:hypothetical protein